MEINSLISQKASVILSCYLYWFILSALPIFHSEIWGLGLPSKRGESINVSFGFTFQNRPGKETDSPRGKTSSNMQREQPQERTNQKQKQNQCIKSRCLCWYLSFGVLSTSVLFPGHSARLRFSGRLLVSVADREETIQQEHCFRGRFSTVNYKLQIIEPIFISCSQNSFYTFRKRTQETYSRGQFAMKGKDLGAYSLGLHKQ